MKLWIYIAGPYTNGDVGENVRQAVLAGMRLREFDEKIVPVIPHLFHLAHLISPRDHAFWMAWDLDLLVRCDALYRLPGVSPGADKEVSEALMMDKPVCFSMAELRTMLDGEETFK